MELAYEITEEDYIGFNLYHLRNSKAHQRTFVIVRYGFSIISGLIMYYIGTEIFSQPALYWGIIAIAFGIIWILKYPKQHDKQIRKQMLKIFKEGDNSSVFGHKTMIIDNEKIQVLDEFSSEVVMKKNIKEIKILEEFILVYISGFTAHIIPTRYFDDVTRDNILKELNYNTIEK